MNVTEADTEQSSVNDDELEAALPNRVAALVQAEDDQSLKRTLMGIKESVQKAVIAMFEEVEQRVAGGKQIAARQVNGFFESFFVFSPYSESDHAGSFARAQAKMEARKNIRNFLPSFEYGFKCTQCGNREPMKGNAPSDVEAVDMRVLRKYWATRRTGQDASVFKENEMLCSVCCGKRLLRRVHSEKHPGIPSTSALAVAAWVDENSALLDRAWSSKFVALLKKTGMNWECTPVNKNRQKRKVTVNSRPSSSYLNDPMQEQTSRPLLSVDGDYFYPDSYDRFLSEVQNGDTAHVVSAKKALRELLEQSGVAPPPRYLAIVTFDADGMGDLLRRVESKEEHKRLTLQLGGFALEVKRICYEKFHGHVIYVGGDEGVVLTPLSEMLPMMECLRIAFAQTMQGRLTLSAGAAVIHHQSPLGQGIGAAHAAIKKAKALRDKNAFAVSIIKRSGSRTEAVAPWIVNVDGQECGLVDFLEKWFSLYRSGDLSPRWFYQLRKRLANIRDEKGKNRRDIAEMLLFQVLPRHALNPKTALELAANAFDLMAEGRGLGDFDRLVDLLYLPLYIFQGGDR